MVFTTKHVMYQVKESVFEAYLYVGIFQPSREWVKGHLSCDSVSYPSLIPGSV